MCRRAGKIGSQGSGQHSCCQRRAIGLTENKSESTAQQEQQQRLQDNDCTLQNGLKRNTNSFSIYYPYCTKQSFVVVHTLIIYIYLLFHILLENLKRTIKKESALELWSLHL